MNRTILKTMTLAGLACLSPIVGDAQEFIAGPPINCTITRPRPVVTTQMRPQQVTTFCDVTETQMTSRQIVEQVPITTCKTVTRDEGGYQMVWVPKPVSRQVAETTMMQQVKTVAVPVQVTRKVPSVSTQFVPVQTVQYMNETVPLQMTTMAMSAPCSTCGNSTAFAPSPIMAPQLGYAPAPYSSAPSSTAMIPSMPAISVPSYSPSLTPVARPQASAGEWQNVPARSASASASSAYETVPAREVPRPRDESIVTPRKTSKFSGVPSAAAVWQAQGANSR